VEPDKDVSMANVSCSRCYHNITDEMDLIVECQLDVKWSHWFCDAVSRFFVTVF